MILGVRDAKDTQKTERTTSEENGESKQQTTELQENQTVVQQSGTQSGQRCIVGGGNHAGDPRRVNCGHRRPAAFGAGTTAAGGGTVLQLSTDKIMVLPGQGGNGHG